MTPQQGEGERLRCDCAPATRRSLMDKPKPQPSQNPPGWQGRQSSQLAAEMSWMLPNQPQFPSLLFILLTQLVLKCKGSPGAASKFGVGKERAGEQTAALVLQKGSAGERGREPRRTKKKKKMETVRVTGSSVCWELLPSELMSSPKSSGKQTRGKKRIKAPIFDITSAGCEGS